MHIFSIIKYTIEYIISILWWADVFSIFGGVKDSNTKDQVTDVDVAADAAAGVTATTRVVADDVLIFSTAIDFSLGFV